MTMITSGADATDTGEHFTDSPGHRHSRRLAERAIRHEWVPAGGESAQRIRRIGMVGAGVMGTAIARIHLEAGYSVHLFDVSPAALKNASIPPSQVGRDASSGAGPSTSGGQGAAEFFLSNQLNSLAHCDLVIESVVENRTVKQQLLEELEAICADDTILTTNTSTIPVADLAGSLRDETRLCGLHFCNPVGERPLVEVVKPRRTRTSVVGSAVQHVRQLSKIPIVVGDHPGFVVNRLLLPYLNEALLLVCEGVEPTAIDRAAERFGFALGPLAAFDMIGIDTALLAGRTLWEAFPQRTQLTPVLPALAKRGWLGRKSGQGFYGYEADSRRRRFEPAVRELLAAYTRRRRSMTDQKIIYRLLLPMLLEASRVLEEGAAERAEDVDTAVVFGLAFPKQHGGIFYWADKLGPEHLLHHLRQLEYLGPRMQPTPLLNDLACGTRRFYATTQHRSSSPT